MRLTVCDFPWLRQTCPGPWPCSHDNDPPTIQHLFRRCRGSLHESSFSIIALQTVGIPVPRSPWSCSCRATAQFVVRCIIKSFLSFSFSAGRLFTQRGALLPLLVSITFFSLQVGFVQVLTDVLYQNLPLLVASRRTPLEASNFLVVN